MASLFVAAILVTMALQTIGNHIIVQTIQGKLIGTKLYTAADNKTYYSFKGVPYAKPPVGALRFKAPQDPERWGGARVATDHGPVCPQYNHLTNMFTTGSEDCLYLNVYTPTVRSHSHVPVVVTIHGGAYSFGSGNDDNYGPDFLISKDVVSVVFNYRLGVLGFLSLDTCDVPGNAGLKDQVAALKWVQRNIYNFGGDPRNVTVLGSSWGAVYVGYHLISPMSAGLFQRAILMSGVPLCDWTTSFKPLTRAYLLATTLGFQTNRNRTTLLSVLKNVPYQKLINISVPVMTSETLSDVIFKMDQFPPVIEKKCKYGNFLTEDPMVLLKSRRVNKVDVMFSYNSLESLFALPLYESYIVQRYNRFPEMFVPSDILIRTPPEIQLHLGKVIQKHYFGRREICLKNMANFIYYSSNVSFAYPIQKFFKAWPPIGNRYFFKFSSFSSRNIYGRQGAPYNLKGAAHFDDLFYIYDPKAINMTLDKNSIEYKMIQDITTAITNFVKDGDPAANMSLGIKWPKFNNITLPYMNFGEKLSVGYAPEEEDYNFWDKIYRAFETGVSL